MRQYLNISTLNAMQVFQMLRFAKWVFIGIMLSKSELTQTQIGWYEQAMMWGTFFSFFWVSATMNTLLSQYPIQTKEEKKIYLSQHVLFFLVCNLIFLFLLFILPAASAFTFKIKVPPYLHWAVLVFFFSNVSFYAEYMLLLWDKAKSLLSYGIIIYTLEISVVAFTIFYFSNLVSLYITLILFGVAKCLYAAYLIAPHFKWRLSNFKLAHYFQDVFPLAFAFLVSSSNEFVDKWLVSQKFDPSVFAQYTYGAKEFVVATILATGLSSVSIPLISKNLEHGLNELKKRTMQYVRVIFPLAALGMWFTCPFIPIILNKNFTQTWVITNIFLLLVASRLLFPQTILNALQIKKPIMLSAIMEIILNIVCSIAFLYWWGLPGIALATVVAFAFDKIFLMWYLHSFKKIKPNMYIVLPEYLLWCGFLFINFTVSYLFWVDKF